MAVTVALLQGVNVGKYKRISMADLKTIIANLGGEDVTTVANSGNVVFRHDARDSEELRSIIQQAVSDHVGLPIPTLTRSAGEMQKIVAENPYSDVTDSKCLHVEFLNDAIPDVLEGINLGDDDLTVIGREIYLHLPNKMSGATYDSTTLFKRLDTQHTSRNWSTVTKLAELSAKISQAF